MSSTTTCPGPQSLGHRTHGPARLLAYMCRPQPAPTPSTSTSSSSSPFIVSTPQAEELYPELEILDHLFLHIPPSLPPGHSPITFLQRALSSAVSRHRYCYYDTYPNQRRDHSIGSSTTGSDSPDADAAALASTDIRACDIRINLRQSPNPTVFGPLPLYTSWMLPLSTLGENRFRSVLLDIAQNRGVAEVIVLLQPIIIHSDEAEADDDDIKETGSNDEEAEGSDDDANEDGQDSPDIPTSA
ncbi:hypothetical protein PG984_007188 [Apiospora sp. TS-2023a]